MTDHVHPDNGFGIFAVADEGVDYNTTRPVRSAIDYLHEVIMQVPSQTRGAQFRFRSVSPLTTGYVC